MYMCVYMYVYIYQIWHFSGLPQKVSSLPAVGHKWHFYMKHHYIKVWARTLGLTQLQPQLLSRSAKGQRENLKA